MEQHPLRRVTGWEHGLGEPRCYLEPYRWLDDTHLMLYPVVGEEWGRGCYQWTLPVVLNLETGATWLPPVDERHLSGFSDEDMLPKWSDALRALLATRGGEVFILSADGQVLEQFLGNGPLHLAPSGRRLLAGFSWRDLETGQSVELQCQTEETFVWWNPAWSSDETRLFDCCHISSGRELHAYADVGQGECTFFNLGGLLRVGREGNPGYGWWVLDDTRVVIQADLEDGGDWGVMPLVDPVAQVYTDVRFLTSQSPDQYCVGSVTSVAPNGEHMLINCGQSRDPAWYLLNLRSFHTQTVFSGQHDWDWWDWSPDSRFALLSGRGYRRSARTAKHYLLSVADGSLGFLTETLVPDSIWGFWSGQTWSPSGGQGAFFAQERRTLVVLDAEAGTARQVSLPGSSWYLSWHPQGGGLAGLVDDGSVWWVPVPFGDTVELLTPSLPAVRDLRWSPDGNHLAFVSGADVYVVSVSSAEP